MRKLCLEDEIVEERACLDPEAAFKPGSSGGLGKALPKGEVDAQHTEDRELAGPEHQGDRALPVALISKVAKHLPFEFDPIAAETEVGAGEGDGEGGNDNFRKARSGISSRLALTHWLP